MQRSAALQAGMLSQSKLSGYRPHGGVDFDDEAAAMRRRGGYGMVPYVPYSHILEEMRTMRWEHEYVWCFQPSGNLRGG